MNMYQFFEQTMEKCPTTLFLVREKITFQDFPKLVRARATTLKKLGVQYGDTLGVLAHNIPEFIITMFAAWYCGARVLLLDTNLTNAEYDNMTSLVQCKLVMAEKSFFYDAKGFEFFDIQTVDSDTDVDLTPYPLNANDIATLSFTSGATGVPKIVPLTHFNLIECANSFDDFNQWFQPGGVLYGFLPLYHIFGFAAGFLAPLHFQMGILLQSSINPKLILQDFKDYRPHVIPSVPKMWELFRKKIIEEIKSQKKWWIVSFVLKNQKWLRKIGLGVLVRNVQNQIKQVFGGRVQLMIAGGAATKPEVENFYNSLGIAFIQGYGMTETVGPFCGSKPSKKRVPYAFGAPLGTNECEIRDKDEDGIGMLWVRGHQVFGGYMNNDEANTESFDERGFFKTGDLVYMDKNGELHFAGRKKQVIVLDSGKNVYPDELEALFLDIPGVNNVAVFEHVVNDKTVAYAVFSVDDDMTAERLKKAVADANKKVAQYKWVTHMAMTTDDLPMTSTQKVKHFVVKQNLEKGMYTEI
ncbi:MAG: AMP-binding protein [Alphaproteobacteria bacterium]|nr:AMP-binding protein [Alphaproteobacteria bacterium]